MKAAPPPSPPPQRPEIRPASERAAAVAVAPPMPSFGVAWASLVYAVATMLLGYPALTGQFLINPRSDQYLAGYAFRDFGAQSLRAGLGFPQWNPYLQGGLPYNGAMHGDIFYPTFLLRMIMPTDAAMTWEFVIHLFLAGLFTFLFLRAWRFSFYAALVGGLAYMLGGSIAGYASPGHDGKLFVSALLPAALHLLTLGMRDGRRWAWGLLALVIGLGVLSPHPQLLQYLLLTVGVFALYLAFGGHDRGTKLPTSVAIKRLALAAGSVALGALIGAIQFAPVFAYKPWSPRAGGHSWDIATSYSFPIEETFNAYLPQFSGILGQYWGQNGIHLHSDYFGVVVLLLAGAAFGKTVGKSFRLFWVGVGAIALVWAFGGHTPLFHVILALVPGTKYFRAPSMMIYVVAFAASVIAAIGMDRILARRVGPKYAVGWAVAGLAIALLMSVGGYHVLVDMASSIIATNYPPEVHSQVVDEFAQRAAPNAQSAMLGAWRSFFFVLLGAGVIWSLATDRLPAKAGAILLTALVAVDLWSIERLYWIFSPPASVIFASDPAENAILADIKSSGRPGRVLTLAGSEGVDRMDPAFRGDALMIHGLRIPMGYHGNELGIYQQLVGVDSGQIVQQPAFWRQENVQYLYTGADQALLDQQLSKPLGIPPLVKLAGPIRNAAGSMVYAYRMPMVNPAAWLADGIIHASDDQVLPVVLDPRFDPSRAALVPDTSNIPAMMATVPAAATVQVQTTRFDPGQITVELTPATPGKMALLVSENYYPGWSATGDGKPLQLTRANFNLIGVALPQGIKTIQLRFRDPAYDTGKTLTLLSLALAAIAWLIGLAFERRGRMPLATVVGG